MFSCSPVITSHINGKQTVYFPSHEKDRRVRRSNAIITVAIMCVIAVVSLIFFTKLSLMRNGQEDLAGIAVSTAIFLKVL